MPRSPILDREIYYERLTDGSLRRMEFNLVNTSLGGMIEPVSNTGYPGATTDSADNLLDDTVDRIMTVRQAEIAGLFPEISGLQGPRTY